MRAFHWGVCCLFLIQVGVSPCSGAETSGREYRYFEQHVRPLLVKHCYECHSEDSDEVGGNLLLDSKEGWTRGGDLGPAIVPGDPDASLLVQAVSYLGDELQMPPEGRLANDEVAILDRWVRMGAPDPRRGAKLPTGPTELDIEAGRNFWAFQPVDASAIQLPSVTNRDWARNNLDRFVLAQLEQRGLRPAPPADRRTLIRRVTFDLIGLPPTPAEVEDFLNDHFPDAYSRLVDRLLASRHYGERWGRFWLAVARYADSNGLDENIAHGNAWRYRDYVIRAFNEDKPYDQFVSEQLAGDLLGPADAQTQRERAIATGFLSLGPKVLAEVDESKMEMDIIDEQVDTVGRALMALTLGCARCHDHKFDPIRTEDYYALAGIFKSTKTMEHFKKIARWNEVSIATEQQQLQRQKLEGQIAEQKQQIGRVTSRANEQLRSRLPAGESLPDDVQKHYDEPTRKELQVLQAQLKQLEESLPELPTAMGVAEYDAPTNLTSAHSRQPFDTRRTRLARFSRRAVVRQIVRNSGIDDSSSGRLPLARWLVEPSHPLLARVMVNRIWRWHFGRGLVESTDNFGHLGDLPTNQPLLDWLALQFVDAGWSIKAMHRLIVLSSTYRMSSEFDAANAHVDPDNRFQWRANVRRLEAEVVRDAILEVSGGLDKAMGGSLLHVKNREFLFDHTSKDNTDYSSPRRSVYLPVIRNHLYDVFQLFDYADASVSSSDRESTTVAPQALFVMNSSLVNDAAAAMADRILSSGCDTTEQQIERAYLLVFGRRPNDHELERDRSYLKEFAQSAKDMQSPDTPSARTALRLLCHALLASNEFIYVR